MKLTLPLFTSEFCYLQTKAEPLMLGNLWTDYSLSEFRLWKVTAMCIFSSCKN